MTDWRDAVARLGAGRVARRRLPVRIRVRPGARVLLGTPARFSRARWGRIVRALTHEWRRAIRADTRLRPIARAGGARRYRSGVRAELFVVTE
jgi:hypothetical protein